MTNMMFLVVTLLTFAQQRIENENALTPKQCRAISSRTEDRACVAGWERLGSAKKLNSEEISAIFHNVTISLYNGKEYPIQQAVYAEERYKSDGTWSRSEAQTASRTTRGRWFAGDDKLCTESNLRIVLCRNVWVYHYHKDIIAVSEKKTEEFGYSAVLYRIDH